MKEKGVALPILLIGGLILGVLVFLVYQSATKGTPAKKEIASVVPPETADFVKDGNMRLMDEGSETEVWRILYGEPGNPAALATLSFNNLSKCDFGSGEQICNEKKFEQGMKVHIEGIQNGSDVKVLKLKVIEE